MQKTKLSTEFIKNAFDFYNENIGKVFSDSESNNLSSKLQEIIEYDNIKIYSGFSKKIPIHSLVLIYFIGEYKKAFLHATKESMKERKNTLESLGKGFESKKKEYKKNLSILNDGIIDPRSKIEVLLKKLLLMSLKNKRYSKVGMLILGLIYNNLPLYTRELRWYFTYDKRTQTIMDTLEDTLKYFEYTHLSPDKIVNSLLIVLYTRLILLGLDKNKAFKWSKEITALFIDDRDVPTDKYRLSYLTENEIYFAGLYNGMPIYQWYTGSKESYYDDNDVKQFQKFIKIMERESKQSFIASFLGDSLFKALAPKQEMKLDEAMNKLIDDTPVAHNEMISTHKMFSNLAIRLVDVLIPPKITLFQHIFAFVFRIATIFTSFKTKFTNK